jgi:hypothetical protein
MLHNTHCASCFEDENEKESISLPHGQLLHFFFFHIICLVGALLGQCYQTPIFPRTRPLSETQNLSPSGFFSKAKLSGVLAFNLATKKNNSASLPLINEELFFPGFIYVE